MAKVYIVLKDGVIWDSYTNDPEVELEVLDLDADDDIEREDIEEQVRELEERKDNGELWSI
jgi:hypothetical protein